MCGGTHTSEHAGENTLEAACHAEARLPTSLHKFMHCACNTDTGLTSRYWKVIEYIRSTANSLVKQRRTTQVRDGDSTCVTRTTILEDPSLSLRRSLQQEANAHASRE